MPGIISYGAYIPFYRMGQETIGWKLKSEKAVANFDEDSITMGVAASINCLTGFSRENVKSLYFASTTPPYIEKSNGGIVAVASDLPLDILNMDLIGSLRAGTNALKLAIDSVREDPSGQALLVAADIRVAQPRSEIEGNVGDGAAALLLGKSNVAVELEDYYSTSQEIMDIWRAEGDVYIRSWEDRFVSEQGYLKMLPKAVKGIMIKNNLKPKDFAKVAICGPNARRHQQMTRLLGFNSKSQVQDPLFDLVGNAGSASALMMLIGALEEAKPGERILVANYGNGADALIFRVTEKIEALRRNRRGTIANLRSKKILQEYETYLNWRGLFDKAPLQRRPPQRTPSPAAMLREIDKNMRFHGTKCTHCGYPQYPPQRVCTRCHTKDEFADYPFSDKKGYVYTYTLDYLAPTLDPPMVVAVINFDGGGRTFCIMTDYDIKQLAINMPIELTFRRLHQAEGINNYFWKCQPIR
jgi:hydroxymethylglutaryl-CoA synthase